MWDTTLEELGYASAAMAKRAGKPYARPMNEAERDEKAEVVANMRAAGLMPRG